MNEQGEGLVELLLLQATPFCNLDCSYCYLPGRTRTNRMTLDTLAKALAWVRRMGCRDDSWCLVWHVGEPLAVPVEWYREAHQLCGEVLNDRPLELNFQTNGTLLGPEWIRLAEEDPRVRICVSLDGPEWIHDLQRRNRGGRGTHAQALRGALALKAAGVPFDAICVLGEESLAHPDALFDFFAELGPRFLSFNPINIDGVNQRSPIAESPEAGARYRRCLRRIAELYLRERTFTILNFHFAEQALRNPLKVSQLDGTRLTRPWRAVSVDAFGDVHTFSPSLLGLDLPGVGKAIGNVHRDSFESTTQSRALSWLREEIEHGVEACRSTCPHFSHCGGGSPAHKWFEHKSFRSTETAYCRLGVQADWECYLDAVAQR